jgi:hypothetical protein
VTTPESIATALRNHADGSYCLAAAAELLIAQAWLDRADFTSRFITLHRSPPATRRSPSSTGPPPSRPWAPAFPAQEASSGC